MLCCGYTSTDFPISIRLTLLALWQCNDCPSASKATLKNMDKHFMWIHYERLHTHNKAKQIKTVCIFLGILYLFSVVRPPWHMKGASRFQGPVSISHRTSYFKISQSIEARRFVFRIVRLIWNVTGTSATLLPAVIQSDMNILTPISRSWDFAKSHYKTSYRILKRGHEILRIFMLRCLIVCEYRPWTDTSEITTLHYHCSFINLTIKAKEMLHCFQ